MGFLALTNANLWDINRSHLKMAVDPLPILKEFLEEFKIGYRLCTYLQLNHLLG